MKFVRYAVLLVVFAAAPATSADFWKPAGEPGVVTNNDCGFVSAASGAPVIKRSFMAEGEQGLTAYVADRINAGDVVEVPVDARLEITSGNNVVMVFGAGARARLLGLRVFAAAGLTANRLDVELLHGEMRAQVRLNDENPESVLISLGGAEVLLTRGDAAVFTDAAWRAAALSGAATARVRRGGVVGAPFEFSAGAAVGANGEDRVDSKGVAAIQGRMPFSFEIRNAALPPRPAAGTLLEAP